MLNCLKFETGANPQPSLISLHGLGAKAEDILSIIKMLPTKNPIRIIVPQAPIITVGIYNNQKIPGWFNITALDNTGLNVDAQRLAENTQLIKNLIEKELADNMQVFLLGFSQGGMLALNVSLQAPHGLQGVIGLSTRLLTSSIARQVEPKPKILLCHGTKDYVVPFEEGKSSADRFKEAGYSVKFRKFEIGHTVDMTVLLAVAIFMSV